MEVSWHQSSAHTGWLTGDCWAAKSLEMENKLFYSWTLYHLSFGFTVSHHSGTYSQREGQDCWIFLLHPNATRQKRWKCDIWMSEKAASAGVFVEIRRLIYKIYGEVTWKQEKKMAPGKIPTTFRITSQKRTIFFGLLVKQTIETFKHLKTLGSTFSQMVKNKGFLGEPLPKFFFMEVLLPWSQWNSIEGSLKVWDCHLMNIEVVYDKPRLSPIRKSGPNSW